MNCSVKIQQMLPGVYMLTDRMGMHMTLLTGTERALLVDCGYGFDDLPAAIRTVTDLPLTVLLTHGHHDHACGAYQFDEVLVHEDEMPVLAFYAGKWRKRVWDQAVAKGLDLSDWTEEKFLSMPAGNGKAVSESEMDLGGLTAQILHCPGHTAGSLCIYVKENRLLLPGDDMNPTTWIFFPECEGLAVLKHSLEKAAALPFEQVLCPHFDRLLPRSEFDLFLSGLTPETIRATATPAFQLWEGKKVYAFHPAPQFNLCFDFDKLPDAWKERFVES